MAKFNLKATHRNQVKWHPNIKQEEFAHPEWMAPSLIRALGETREKLGIPMYFTFVGSALRHPDGDAVAADAKSHARFSLHRAGVNHTESYRAGSLVLNADQLGVAVDMDFGPNYRSLGALFDLYVKMESLNTWGGIGIYPDWINPGFHLDMREPTHNAYGARWVGRKLPGVTKQVYPKLTWKVVKEMALKDD